MKIKRVDPFKDGSCMEEERRKHKNLFLLKHNATYSITVSSSSAQYIKLTMSDIMPEAKLYTKCVNLQLLVIYQVFFLSLS